METRSRSTEAATAEEITQQRRTGSRERLFL